MHQENSHLFQSQASVNLEILICHCLRYHLFSTPNLSRPFNLSFGLLPHKSLLMVGCNFKNVDEQAHHVFGSRE